MKRNKVAMDISPNLINTDLEKMTDEATTKPHMGINLMWNNT